MLHTTADLRGYLACDASGPIGIARALVAADREGQVQVVGMDAIGPIAAAVANGVLESSVATISRMQGRLQSSCSGRPEHEDCRCLASSTPASTS